VHVDGPRGWIRRDEGHRSGDCRLDPLSDFPWLPPALPHPTVGLPGPEGRPGFHPQTKTVAMTMRLLVASSLAVLMLGCSGAEQDEPSSEDTPETAPESFGTIERLDPGLDAIVPPDAVVERATTGFSWVEGPVWTRDGTLMFSAIHDNSIQRWTPGEGVATFLQPAGYQGEEPYGGPEPGTNGLTLDPEGRLVAAGHARRTVFRLESLDPGAPMTVLADSYQGRPFSSPNDLTFKSDGSLYFTDPPYGLPTQGDQDPLKEQPVNGVYRLRGAASIPAGAEPDESAVDLIIDDLTRPNGIAFSPDEQSLYVGISDRASPVWMRYDVQPDGSVANGSVFLSAAGAEGIGGPDGIKFDQEGNLYGSGPGGLWIISPEGTHLGTVLLPERASNCAWGGPDGQTLFITASSSVYSIRLNIPGVLP
jgi:gluconolactonase